MQETLLPGPYIVTKEGMLVAEREEYWRASFAHFFLRATMEERKTHVCPTCGSSFTAAYFTRHHFKKHGKDQELHFCEIFRKSFVLKQDLIAHVRQHEGVSLSNMRAKVKSAV